MNSVMTVTFNPCIDKSLETDRLQPDIKLRCTQPRLEPGGGGINVARVIHRLGGKALAIYPSGGYHGSLLTEMLLMEGIDTFAIPILADIREDVNVRETSTGHQYRFIEPGPALTDHVWNRCVDVLASVDKGGTIVISGSLPPGYPADLWKRIRRVADNKSAQLVVDVKGEDLRHALACGVYLIKPSEDELIVLARELGLPPSPPEKTAANLIASGRTQVVVVSHGAHGATLVTAELTQRIKAPEVHKVSTVGAGDSLLAGLLVGLSRKMSLANAVRFGVACGAATVMRPGTELCQRKDAEAVFSRMEEEEKEQNQQPCYQKQ